MSEPKRLPYGLSDYSAVHEKDMLYLDKTRFIPVLENAGEFSFFLRPRRFGKSLTLSLLHCYYDVNFLDRFDGWFKGTWIGSHPTAEKNSYLILPFDFSQVSADPAKVEASFEWHASIRFDEFLKRYQRFMDEDIAKKISQAPSASGRLEALFLYAQRKQLKLYVLIDEYDNFTNTLLSLPERGPEIYSSLTHADGFFRDFFKVLKGGTVGPDSALGRLLITGVSPVTMDDVTSGFNIGVSLSRESPFARFVGFTRMEVTQMLEQQHVADILGMAPAELLELLEAWYGGYRFNEYESEPLFNPDMVLFFMRSVHSNQKMPLDMIDHNVRIDYTKLRHLVLVEKQLNGNFKRLKSLIDQGYCHTLLVDGFPLEKLTYEPHFYSLLYYLGLLTISGWERGKTRLVIPNKTIAKLMYGYLHEAMEENGVFNGTPVKRSGGYC